MEIQGTYLRLPKTTLRRLKALAVAQDKSLAALVRDAIEQTYHIDASIEPKDPAADPFMKLIGSIHSGHRNDSVDHDKYIYGE